MSEKEKELLEKIDAFKKDLAAVLLKHNAAISFTCGECSDLAGIYDEHMEGSLWIDGKEIFFRLTADGHWDLTEDDL